VYFLIYFGLVFFILAFLAVIDGFYFMDKMDGIAIINRI
jgi:hypothetical protein